MKLSYARRGGLELRLPPPRLIRAARGGPQDPERLVDLCGPGRLVSDPPSRRSKRANPELRG